jgi:hypothetical protein
MLFAMGSQVNTPANHAAYSFDGGVTFTQAVIPDPGAAGWFGAAYSPSLGYAICVAAGGFVAQSFDGMTWIAMPGNNLNNSNWQGGVVRNADDTLFVTTGIGGVAGLRAATSPDGANWTLRVTPAVAAEGAAFGTRLLLMDDGDILAIAGASTTRSIIRSQDGGITWAYTRAAGLAIDTSDWDRDADSDYIHLAGFTGANVGDTFFTTDDGATLTRSLRDALNDPNNCSQIAIDPDNGFVYQAGGLGVFRGIIGNENNPPAGGWVNVYPAGTVGAASRGGFIPVLRKIIFTSATGGFTTHQLDPDTQVWSSTVHPVLPGTARVKLDFLGFPPP